MLVEKIGAGGMGVVWLAHDVDLGRDVAMKLIDSSTSSLAELELRCLREARAMARLSHPNVVSIYDLRTTGDGFFIAMQLVHGGTLTEWLRASRRSWREVVAIFLAAGRGLAAAHRADLVHRDFKPDNVLVGEDGVARVSDFGIALGIYDPVRVASVDAASVDAASGGRAFTQDGLLVGTRPYMAPEQLRGDRVTARSDQFSFCVALHEALYGARPFAPRGQAYSTTSHLDAIQEGRISDRRTDRRVPDRVHHVIARGISVNPDRRWPSMDVLLDELARSLRAGAPRLRTAIAAAVTALATATAVSLTLL